MEQLYDKKTTCMFTGHRYIPYNDREKIKNALKKVIREHISRGICTFISGGAVGFDMLAARCVLEEREKNRAVRLVMMLPCRDQHKRWGALDQRIYEEILKVADDIYVLNERYISGCMHQRNRVMVEQSGHCIAYFDGRAGGTFYTIDLAREKGLLIENIY